MQIDEKGHLSLNDIKVYKIILEMATMIVFWQLIFKTPVAKMKGNVCFFLNFA